MGPSASQVLRPGVASVRLYFLPVKTRIPWKFGSEVLTEVTCARVCLELKDADSGTVATGWGETPLSVQWVWPSATIPYADRHKALTQFTILLAKAWTGFAERGHALQIGHAFIEDELLVQLDNFNVARRGRGEPVPHLAALVCCAAFDQALHDAYGKLVDRPVYETYTEEFMSHDLSHYLQPAEDANFDFVGRYPKDYLATDPPDTLVAWHAVGGLDPLGESEMTGDEPDDGYPLTLEQWIERDGLKALKLKLSGNDAEYDYNRIVAVGQIAERFGVDWLTTDFNCTVNDPAYVNAILDRLRDQHPSIYSQALYVEQPFPYDLEANPIDVRSVSSRKPLFMDESAHDWRLVRLGRSLGWNGVALKTCKTQTGAILSLCWARAHGMSLMVQDLTNPMLAQVPHLLLAAHAGTIMGVETNSMQFYPDASECEARVHPGIYRRRDGVVNLSTLQGPGFGYRIDEIQRDLPSPAYDSAST